MDEPKDETLRRYTETLEGLASESEGGMSYSPGYLAMILRQILDGDEWVGQE